MSRSADITWLDAHRQDLASVQLALLHVFQEQAKKEAAESPKSEEQAEKKEGEAPETKPEERRSPLRSRRHVVRTSCGS